MDMGMRGLANCKLHFLAPHPSTFGLFGNASINLVLNVAFFPVFTQGTPYLGDLPSKWHFVWQAHPKKLHLQRESLHLGRFYHGRPSKIQLDRKLHIGRYQFSTFREKQLHLASTHSPKIEVTRRNHLIRRGSSKTMKNDNMFSNELVCQDARLASSYHPMTCFVLRHYIDGVSSPLTCASVLWIREDWVKPNRTEAIPHRTALCWRWRKKRSALAQR